MRRTAAVALVLVAGSSVAPSSVAAASDSVSAGVSAPSPSRGSYAMSISGTVTFNSEVLAEMLIYVYYGTTVELVPLGAASNASPVVTCGIPGLEAPGSGPPVRPNPVFQTFKISCDGSLLGDSLVDETPSAPALNYVWRVHWYVSSGNSIPDQRIADITPPIPVQWIARTALATRASTRSVQPGSTAWFGISRELIWTDGATTYQRVNCAESRCAVYSRRLGGYAWKSVGALDRGSGLRLRLEKSTQVMIEVNGDASSPASVKVT